MTPQTPAVGQPLDAESVRLLVKGDLLRAESGAICTVKSANPDSFRTERGLNSKGFASAFTFLGRPDQDGWIKHDGKSVPVRGIRVDVRTVGTGEWSDWLADQWGVSWLHEDDEADHIIAWRPTLVAPSSAQPAIHGREALGYEIGGVITRLNDCLESATEASVPVDTGDLRTILSLHRAEALDNAVAEKGPGGWLICSGNGVWEWTGVRMSAVAALTEGLEVWSVARGCYEGAGLDKPSKGNDDGAAIAPVSRLRIAVEALETVERISYADSEEETVARRALAALAPPTQDEPLGVDLGELKRLAEAATPGPWFRGHNENGAAQGEMSVWPDPKMLGQQIAMAGHHAPWAGWFEQASKDAAYIAAANPAVILKLIAEIERRGRK